MIIVKCHHCKGRGYFRTLDDQWNCAVCGGKGAFINGQTGRVFTSLREANAARQVLWNGGEHKSNGPLYAATELAGEVGELCNVVKKLEREKRGLAGSRATRGQLEDEIGDVLICLDLLASEYGVDINVAAGRKFNKTSEKLGFPVAMEDV